MLVALGVTGGIAAYKACEVLRGLQRAGVDVQVIMTENATRFITPLTLQTLSGRRVLLKPFGLDEAQTIQHIELTRDVSAFVVAPATANTLAKFVGGIADDLLSTFYVSVTAPVVIAPAMNTRMWLHPSTQRNVEQLRARGVRIVDPESGWLAEREEGRGRLAEPETIVAAALEAARRSTQLAGKSVVVTAGPTRVPLDPVRYLTNRSSGKMGFALANALARRGAEVTLISGPVSLPTPFGVGRIDVETVEQMRVAVHERRRGAAAVFMAAAVSDYVTEPAAAKIKKSGAGLRLALDDGPDILAEIGRDRQEGLLIGFAAETAELLDHARAKLERKNLDFIVANDVSRPDIGFDVDQNAVTILGRDGTKREVSKASKAAIAETILDTVLAEVDR